MRAAACRCGRLWSTGVACGAIEPASLTWGLDRNTRILAGAALAIAFAISPAFAADMPTKAPVALPPPAPQWTGFNVGLSLGGRWADIQGTTLSFGPLPPPF